MLRIKPSDNCIIQKLNCDTGEWLDWFGDCLETSIADARSFATHEAVTQSHDTIGQIVETDAPHHGSGECKEYDLVITANQQYLLPLGVVPGDTIEITNCNGATTDGASAFPFDLWYWPNGHVYRGLPGEVFDVDPVPANSDDRLPSGNHMELIANIDGVWHSAFNTTLVVPNDATDTNVIFQINDSNLADNSGTTRCHVKVCKSSYDCVEFDFTANNGGWAEITALAPAATYVSGEGWGSLISGPESRCNIQSPVFTSSNILSVKVWYHTDTDHGGAVDRFVSTNTWDNGYGDLDNGVGDFVTTIEVSRTNVTQIFIVVARNGPPTSTNYRISKVQVVFSTGVPTELSSLPACGA